MRQIGFRARYIEAILAGSKTTTIRPDTARLPHVGEIVSLRCRYDLPPFAWARTLAVSPLKLRSLSDADAIADGHDTAAELRRSLRELYGTRPLVSIRFELVDRPGDALRLFGDES